MLLMMVDLWCVLIDDGLASFKTLGCTRLARCPALGLLFNPFAAPGYDSRRSQKVRKAANDRQSCAALRPWSRAVPLRSATFVLPQTGCAS